MSKLAAYLALALTLLSSATHAALLSRASGAAYFDDDLGITWIADANLARTDGTDADGLMTWFAARDWISSLNAGSYLGHSDWRLPDAVDLGEPGCQFNVPGGDCGYNVDVSSGEMAHIFYRTLGNSGFVDTSGVPTGCVNNVCLTNRGPFANLMAGPYWYGTEYAAIDINAWNFAFAVGSQAFHAKNTNRFAWAVRSGDIAQVPAPGAAWLLATALAGLFGQAGARRLLYHAPLSRQDPFP